MGKLFEFETFEKEDRVVFTDVYGVNCIGTVVSVSPRGFELGVLDDIKSPLKIHCVYVWNPTLRKANDEDELMFARLKTPKSKKDKTNGCPI